MRNAVAQQQGIGNGDLFGVAFVGRKGDLVGQVGVQTSAHLGCDEAMADWGSFWSANCTRRQLVLSLLPRGQFFQ